MPAPDNPGYWQCYRGIGEPEYICAPTEECVRIKRELVHKPGVVSVVPGGLLIAPEQSTPPSRGIKPIGFPPPLA
jgi:hypothetical protein